MKELIFILMIWSGLFPALLFAADQAASPLIVPFLEGRSAANGLPTEELWERAARTEPFTLYRTGETPKRGTQVLLFYDARNLYVRFLCDHPADEPLKTIINQEMTDARVFNDDCVEVFLSQSPDAGPKGAVFQLAASARAVRFDGVDGKPEAWDGAWKVFADRKGDQWIATFIIPFESMARNGAPAGTPKEGGAWWVNFARSSSRYTEWSQWNPSDKGFASRAHFREIAFGERPGERRVTVEGNAPEELFPGESRITVAVRQAVYRPLVITTRLDAVDRERAGSEIMDRRRIETPQEEDFSFDFPFTSGKAGSYRLVVQAEDAGSGALLDLHAGVVQVIDINQRTESLSQRIVTGEESIARLADAALKEELAKEIGRLKQLLSRIAMQAETSREAGAGKQIVEEADLGNQEAERILRRVRKKLWQEALPATNAPATFCVGASTPFDQIFQEDLYDGAVNQPLRLTLARNESEAAQIVVIPLSGADLEGVEVEVSALKAEAGDAVIPPERWRIGAVGYIETPHQHTDASGRERRFWPDVCLPPGAFDVRSDEQRPVCLRLDIPSDQSAARYRGELTVRVGGQRQTLPVEVEVRDFSLPEVPTLRCDAWMRFRPLVQYYGLKEVSLEQYERILRDFRPYRLSIYPFDYPAIIGKIRLFREKDGSLSADFSDFDPYLDLAIRYGANAINLNLGLSGVLTSFAGGFGVPYLTMTDRATGETKPYPEQCRWPAEDLLDHPDFIAFWKLYWAHAKEKGWDKVAYVEDVDEPNDNSRKELLLRRYRFFREHCAGLPLQSFGPKPSNFSKAIGLIDYWSPVLHSYDADRKALQERRAAGDKLWLYTCGNEVSNAEGDYVPDTFIHYPLIAKRIPALMAWKYKAEGLFHYSFSSFQVHPDLMAKGKAQGAAKPWGRYPVLHAPRIEAGFGISNLTWPGPEAAQLLPSLRLEMIREGREDYEYLVVLRGLTEELAARRNSAHDGLIAASREMLDLPAAIVTDSYRWCRSPEELMAWREQVAGQILKLKETLNR